MNDHKYYRDILGYIEITNGYFNLHHLWHGVELFQDLKMIFGSQKPSDCPELSEERELYLRTRGNYESDSGMLVPIQMIKKNQRYVLQQKDEFIFLDELIDFIKLEIAYPARSSGFIECSIILKTGEKKSLASFSTSAFESRDDNKYFHVTEQVKDLADFLQVPWKLEAFNDT